MGIEIMTNKINIVVSSVATYYFQYKHGRSQRSDNGCILFSRYQFLHGFSALFKTYCSKLS
jgi:hypothetical protein